VTRGRGNTTFRARAASSAPDGRGVAPGFFSLGRFFVSCFATLAASFTSTFFAYRSRRRSSL
jgi:hypothetical protein